MERQPGADLAANRSLEEGQAVLLAGSRCLARLADELGGPLREGFLSAVTTIHDGRGLLVTSGIGKAGHVATKASATFASTGTPSFFLHPTEAVHGDLGRVSKADVVMLFSNSGASEELMRMVQPLREIGATLLAITATEESALARAADILLCYGKHGEAGHLGLAPTTSTTAMLALSDALAMAVFRRRDFTPRDFARFHPAGTLGRKLTRVQDVMRQGDRNPVVAGDRKVFEALTVMSNTPGRPGAASVIDANGRLIGFYTDGDFRRRMDLAAPQNDFGFLKEPIHLHMTRDPRSITADRLVGDAARLLDEFQVDQLPVVDRDGRPIGLLDVQDILHVRVMA